MTLRPCDCCGGAVSSEHGADVFFVARVQIMKAAAWTPDERAAASKLADAARKGHSPRLAESLEQAEPITIIGDKVPALVTHADLRICADCVTKARVLNLIEIVKASELGTRHNSTETPGTVIDFAERGQHVPSSETT